MIIKFTNTDSAGAAATTRLSVTYDGEAYDIPVGDDDTAEVPESVGKHLVQSDDFAIDYAAEGGDGDGDGGGGDGSADE